MAAVVDAEAHDPDHVAALRGVDHPAPAHVHADMSQAPEEEEVARAEPRARDRPTGAELGGGTVRQGHAEPPVDV